MNSVIPSPCETVIIAANSDRHSLLLLLELKKSIRRIKPGETFPSSVDSTALQFKSVSVCGFDGVKAQQRTLSCRSLDLLLDGCLSSAFVTKL